MTDYEKEEFWKGLTRLYESTVKLNDAIEGLRKVAETQELRLRRLEDWRGEKEGNEA